MKSVLPMIAVGAFVALGSGCGPGSGPPAPAEQPSSAVGLTGTWSGTAMDANQNTGIAVTTVDWTITQTDADVSGTAATQSVDVAGTTCNSCHRTKTGTISGTMEGETLTLTMTFPGEDGEITPLCTATLSGTASTDSQGSLNVEYAGADSCEGDILDGTLTLTRQP